MKAEELMIGDWVHCITDNTIVQIEEMFIDEMYGWCYKYGGKLNVLEDIEPIPLTKEILHKNSFYGDVYLWIDAGDEKILEYYPFERRISLYYNEEKSQELLFRCQCFHVHEFQHALKLCKIEKEIIL